MDYEKIYKILMEIVGDQNNVVIESKLKLKKNVEKTEDMSKNVIPSNKSTIFAYAR